MNAQTEFLRDMLAAFEDLPSDAFSEFRRAAVELGVPPEVLCLVAARNYLRAKRREQRRGSSDDP
jgi:hypothetical protein